MNNLTKLATVSAIALILGAPAFAQGAIIGTDALDDQITDIETDVKDELAKGEDAARYGSTEFAPGWTGSLAATINATSGSTKTQDYALAGRFRYGAGLWNHTFGFAVEHGKTNNIVDKDRIFAVYDANRAINEKLYVFGLGSFEADRFGAFEREIFVGFGPGIRIINEDNIAWRVQAGPGVRYTVDGITADENSEVAGIVSSRFFYRLSDNMFLTNDTDVLYSDIAGTQATNDFGISLAVSDNLSTRLGYRTKYIEGADTDNTLNASLVYSFN